MKIIAKLKGHQKNPMNLKMTKYFNKCWQSSARMILRSMQKTISNALAATSVLRLVGIPNRI